MRQSRLQWLVLKIALVAGAGMLGGLDAGAYGEEFRHRQAGSSGRLYRTSAAEGLRVGARGKGSLIQVPRLDRSALQQFQRVERPQVPMTPRRPLTAMPRVQMNRGTANRPTIPSFRPSSRTSSQRPVLNSRLRF